ncbi:GDSL esterase/lipase [Rhynchospora pubera]|uniref:GDSL esterase/lipase n=1 Tax=Rhynchospora pubera TaxID=906938 RepID=A0AAV8H7V3_9POAL|nr:GDSL esterase/lipase [Rhynchospora pubera]
MAPSLCIHTALISFVLFSTSTFAEEAQVPAMFVFGDSLVDPGNNNNLATLAKANYFPNGIDFPEGDTGRYCNGGTFADYLSNLLGLPIIPPYNNPEIKAHDMLQGVNFASAASGILDDTGRFYGELFSMDSQIQNFGRILDELGSVLENRTEDYIGSSFFLVSTGSNDYINNFLLPISQKTRLYTPESFAELVIHEYRRQLKELYDLGGRKFLIGGVGPLGCIPNQIGNNPNASEGTCIESTNILVLQFNTNLKVMLDDLNRSLRGSYFLFWDVYSKSMEIITNYSRYGFKYPLTACCGAGRSKGQIMCLPVLPLECQNRNDHIFWDPYHPTARFNSIVAEVAYNGTLQTTFPMNAMQLALL